jgi:hypothetical protein
MNKIYIINNDIGPVFRAPEREVPLIYIINNDEFCISLLSELPKSARFSLQLTNARSARITANLNCAISNFFKNVVRA